VTTPLVTVVALGSLLVRVSGDAIEPTFAAPYLWLFTGLFLLRVVGQLLVRERAQRWLPPMTEWNLMPYRLLLPVQLTMLAVMVWIDVSFSRGTGAPVAARPALGWVMLVFAAVYASSMAVRYVVRMARRPRERWFGGTIPIVFHWVLAAYVVVLGSFHVSH
jgi:hypothetical protein